MAAFAALSLVKNYSCIRWGLPLKIFAWDWYHPGPCEHSGWNSWHSVQNNLLYPIFLAHWSAYQTLLRFHILASGYSLVFREKDIFHLYIHCFSVAISFCVQHTSPIATGSVYERPSWYKHPEVYPLLSALPSSTLKYLLIHWRSLSCSPVAARVEDNPSLELVLQAQADLPEWPLLVDCLSCYPTCMKSGQG